MVINIPRPRKRRRIGCRPQFQSFGPHGPNCNKEIINLKIEEYESIRLMDLKNLDQSACAELMGIGRSTFQRIYKEARGKIADSIVNGKRIIIETEDFDHPGGKGHCHRHFQDNNQDN
ncbi:DUF134 domain-containing protein [Vallitalea maricola]|uniref:DUF134 domain-containing protein n=1 Tax=Vallitalea maricola TaxID=3074433 RepID=A0ACB5UI63_9FIRM|nr:DUF134 domain-containing protein [Vallitalea sp. AN17-2]